MDGRRLEPQAWGEAESCRWGTEGCADLNRIRIRWSNLGIACSSARYRAGGSAKRIRRDRRLLRRVGQGWLTLRPVDHQTDERRRDPLEVPAPCARRGRVADVRYNFQDPSATRVAGTSRPCLSKSEVVSMMMTSNRSRASFRIWLRRKGESWPPLSSCHAGRTHAPLQRPQGRYPAERCVLVEPPPARDHSTPMAVAGGGAVLQVASHQQHVIAAMTEQRCHRGGNDRLAVASRWRGRDDDRANPTARWAERLASRFSPAWARAGSPRTFEETDASAVE